MLVICPKWVGFAEELMFAKVIDGTSGVEAAVNVAFGLARFGILSTLKACAVRSNLMFSGRVNVLDIPKSTFR